MRRVDDVTEQNVIRDYLDGGSCRIVGERYGIDAVTVFNILKRNNIPRRSKGGLWPLPEQEIVADYIKNVSATSLTKKYGVTTHTILAVLKRHGIEANTYYHNPTLNRDYFSVIDTPDKAYFLGFLITDGNIGPENNVRLELQNRDAYILEKFNQCIGNSNPLRDDRGRFKVAGFKSPEVAQSLAQYGVVPRKLTKTFLPFIASNLQSHLLRGLFDGDGTIGANGRMIGYCSQERIVTDVYNFLVTTLNVTAVKIHKREPAKENHSPVWHVSWSKKDDVKAIAKYLYADKGDFYLRRKFERVAHLL